MVTDKDADALYQWQQTRRKPGGAFAAPVSGFGPRGKLTLWLPPEKPSATWGFQDGKPVLKTVSADADAVAEQLRRKILLSVRNVAAGVMEVEPAFLEYAAHCLNKNYTLTDADLGFALLQSVNWHQGMIVHILGGEGMVDLMTGAAVAREQNELIARDARETAFWERQAAQPSGEPTATPSAPQDASHGPRRVGPVERFQRFLMGFGRRSRGV